MSREKRLGWIIVAMILGLIMLAAVFYFMPGPEPLELNRDYPWALEQWE